MDFELRPERPQDTDFLYRLFLETSGCAVADLPAGLIRMQFAAQRSYYRQRYSEARFDVITVANDPAGRLCVERRAGRIEIIDLALMPGRQGRGLGTAVLTMLMEEGAPVRLRVQNGNRARRLYERLGFDLLDDDGLYSTMEWRPAAGRSAA
jgi:ribosomal protein S18 acetylase RimI-like enzyme